MEIIYYIVVVTVRCILAALQLLMLARAIFSWLPFDEGSPLIRFLYTATEPVIYPVRCLCAKFHIMEGLPLDMPFFFTWIIIMILNMVL